MQNGRRVRRRHKRFRAADVRARMVRAVVECEVPNLLPVSFRPLVRQSLLVHILEGGCRSENGVELILKVRDTAAGTLRNSKLMDQIKSHFSRQRASKGSGQGLGRDGHLAGKDEESNLFLVSQGGSE